MKNKTSIKYNLDEIDKIISLKDAYTLLEDRENPATDLTPISVKDLSYLIELKSKMEEFPEFFNRKLNNNNLEKTAIDHIQFILEILKDDFTYKPNRFYNFPVQPF